MTNHANPSQLDVLLEILEANTADDAIAAQSLTDEQLRASPVPISVGQITTATVTIALGQSISDSVDLGLVRLARIVMPAAWNAAKISFEVSHDGVTYKPFYGDDDLEVTINPPVSVEREMTLSRWLGVRFLKVRSGTVSAPVVQTAVRSLVLVLVP